MWKRAAQFAPFAALSGYEQAVRDVEKNNELLYEPTFEEVEE